MATRMDRWTSRVSALRRVVMLAGILGVIAVGPPPATAQTRGSCSGFTCCGAGAVCSSPCVCDAGSECRYEVSVAPSAGKFGAAGGQGTISVQTCGACKWGVRPSAATASWLHVQDTRVMGACGQVTFSVDRNAGSERSGQIEWSGTSTQHPSPIKISQASGCSYDVRPTSFQVEAAGRRIAVTVVTDPTCGWTVEPGSWVALAAGQAKQRTGPGTVLFDVAANTGRERSRKVTVAEKRVDVTQAGAPVGGTTSTTTVTSTTRTPATTTTTTTTLRNPPGGGGDGCFYPPTADATSFPASGGVGSIAVRTHCLPAQEWTATATASWISIASGASGRGDGTIRFSVAPSSLETPRAATIEIRQRKSVVGTVALTQANLDCRLDGVDVQPSTLDGAMAIGVVTVRSNCPQKAWPVSMSGVLTPMGSSVRASAVLPFFAFENPGFTIRTGTIQVGPWSPIKVRQMLAPRKAAVLGTLTGPLAD